MRRYIPARKKEKKEVKETYFRVLEPIENVLLERENGDIEESTFEVGDIIRFVEQDQEEEKPEEEKKERSRRFKRQSRYFKEQDSSNVEDEMPEDEMSDEEEPKEEKCKKKEYSSTQRFIRRTR